MRLDKVADVELDDDLASAGRAAAHLGVSRPTIDAWQDRRRVGGTDVAAKRTVPLRAVERLRDSQVRNAVLAGLAGQLSTPLTNAEVAAVRDLLDWVHTGLWGGNRPSLPPPRVTRWYPST